MPKIPLFKAKSLGYERDMIAFSVKYKTLPILISKGIVDTGCPYTILTESTLKRTRIPYSNLTTKEIVNIGNIQFQIKELGICDIAFRDEKGASVILKQPIYAGIPIIKGYYAQEIPNFIGRDLLSEHSLSIINKKEGNFILKED